MAANRLVYRLALRRQLRRERVFRDRTHPFELYDDIDLYARYRFRRQDIIDLVDVVQGDIDRAFTRLGSLPALLQVMVALRFYACGCFQIVVGDIFGIDKSTVSRVIERVSRALSSRINEYVRLPRRNEATKTIEKFYQMANFPNVVGCIDCTHVKILRPTLNEVVYVNRKGKHSINVQLVCDADLVITNCVVNWPGSVHDSRILRESALYRAFERVPKPLDGVLLGDSGYPLREWLLTPFIDADTRPKQRYNGAHTTTRCTIERTNGLLKKRWHCLQSTLR